MLVLGVAAAREARLQKRTNGERANIHAIALQQRRNHGNATASRYRSLLLQAVDGLPPSERTLAQGLLGKLDPLVLSQLTRGARRARRQLDNATSAPRGGRRTGGPLAAAAALRRGAGGKCGKPTPRALRPACSDPLVRRVYKAIDWSQPLVRTDQRSTAHPHPPCARGVPAVSELSAPLFVAAEAPERLTTAGAPYGLRMGDKTVAQMVTKISQYLANSSQPAACGYGTCAVVGSSGALRDGDLGAAIDAHDAVIRVNAAPVGGFEAAVGARTTWRVSNSEKPFMLADLEVPELQVAICHMGWIGSCQHQAFSGKYDGNHKGGTGTLAYINPVFYNELWSLLGRPRDKQAPSTGLLAIALALGVCGSVSLYGFGHAGAKAGKQPCRHYWECVQWEDEASYYDPLHQFHDWLAEERLRTLWLRIGLLRDGAASGGGAAGAAAVRAAAAAAADRSDGEAAARWAAVRSEWAADVKTLARYNDARRRSGVKAGQGDFSANVSEILAGRSAGGLSTKDQRIAGRPPARAAKGRGRGGRARQGLLG